MRRTDFRGSRGLCLDVASRGGFDDRELAVAGALGGRNECAGMLLEPAGPHRPPAPRLATRMLQPQAGVGLDLADPVVALLLRRRGCSPRPVARLGPPRR